MVEIDILVETVNMVTGLDNYFYFHLPTFVPKALLLLFLPIMQSSGI